MMKRWTATACIIAATLCAGCANKGMDVNAPGTPQDPPLPRTPSILPLGRGYRWAYSYSDYDSTGAAVRSREELNLEIGNVYGVSGGRLTLLESSAYRDTFEYYAYEYEWENANEGFIVAYRDLHIDTPGLYILGEYNAGSRTLYSSPLLWLAYPSQPGASWTLAIPDSAGADTVTMTLVDTRAAFYAAETGLSDMAAVRFYERCCLYRQAAGSSESWYYYNDEVGCVGYLNYIDGKLRRSYILQSFSQGQYWM
mgnify:CR=1 FL=1